MRRGDVWTIAGGGDYTGKPRPAVVLQDDRFDATASVTVCAFTSDPTDAPLFRLLVEPDTGNGLRTPCRLMVDKITTIPKSKLGSKIGVLRDEDVVRLNRAILVFLGLASTPRRQEQHQSEQPVTPPSELRHPKDQPQMEETVFTQAFMVFMESFSGKVATRRKPSDHHILIDLEDGTGIKELRFTDVPMNRAALAVKEHLANSALFTNTMARIFALREIMDDKRIKPWVKDDPKDPGVALIHPAIIRVAAKMPMNEKGSFWPTKFFKALPPAVLPGDEDE